MTTVAMQTEYGTQSIFINLLDHIANASDKYDRKNLRVRCRRLRGGPTVAPNEGAAAQCIGALDSSGNGAVGVLRGHYDTLNGDHIQFDVINDVEVEGIKIPRTIYSWQHHPFPGCCRFAVNRWVQCFDPEWDADLHAIALRARLSVAKRYSVTTLYVVKGPSYDGGERWESLSNHIYSDGEREMYAIETDLEA